MAQNSLRDFFKEKKQKMRPADIDWAAKRDAWIEAVEQLYGKIAAWLSAAEADVELTRADKVLTENHIGEYCIEDLILRLGDEEVVFSPRGTNIAGAKGRVDVQGDRGEATIVWQEDDRWSIVVSRVPVLRLVPFTADALAEMLQIVMRP